MAEKIDCYFLIESRSKDVIFEFIDKYSIVREGLADEYPFPDLSDEPSMVFISDEDLMAFLEIHECDDYSVYWHNKNDHSKIEMLHVHYTNDGKMILGLGIYDEPESLSVISWFKEIQLYLKSSSACMTSAEFPPLNSKEFVEFCKQRFMPI
jgi:hypothetical protein